MFLLHLNVFPRHYPYFSLIVFEPFLTIQITIHLLQVKLSPCSMVLHMCNALPPDQFNLLKRQNDLSVVYFVYV
jgi:hypothetical protein